MKKLFLLCSLALTGVLGAGIVSCGNQEEPVDPDVPGGTTDDDTGDTFDTSNKIKLYSRDNTSGTRECFFEGIGYSAVKDTDAWEADIVSITKDNGAMMSTVATDVYGIGYCSLDSLENVDGIKGLKFDGVQATVDTVNDESYKLQRNFNYVARLDSKYTDDNLKIAKNAVVAFMTESVEGLAAIEDAGGIVSADAMDAAKPWADIVKESADFQKIASFPSTVTVRTCGSTSVQNCLNSIDTEFNNATNGKIDIVTNQTGSGAAAAGVSGNGEDSSYDLGFLSRELKAEEKTLVAGCDTNAICRDAVVAIVNEKNTVLDNANGELLTKIYKGELATWKDVADEIA